MRHLHTVFIVSSSLTSTTNALEQHVPRGRVCFASNLRPAQFRFDSPNLTPYSAVWLAYKSGGLVVASSNLATETNSRSSKQYSFIISMVSLV